MHTEEDFSHKVVALRSRLGLNQADFAHRLGISRNYVSQLEQGREPGPSLRQLVELLDEQTQAGPSRGTAPLMAAPRKVSPRDEDIDIVGGAVAEGSGIYKIGASTQPRNLLREAREAKGLSQAALAKRVGYSLDVYQGIEEGGSRMGEKMARRVARELGIEVELLTGGADEPPSRDVPFGTFGAMPDIDLGPGMEGGRAKYVPLLSWAECGTMSAFDDQAYTHDGFVAFNPPDGKAFAVRLSGDSMLPAFSEGDVAVVYPSQSPKNGGVVLARLNEDHGGDVMCKLYQARGSRVTLSSYNPAWPAMDFDRADFLWVYPVGTVTKVLR